MPTFGLKSPPAGLTPKEYRDYIKSGIEAEIVRIGAGNVFEHKELVIFYSGPSGIVRITVGKDPLSNEDRALAMAIEMDASRINDTQAGIFLNGQKLDSYFVPTLSALYSDPLELDKALNAAYADVWGCISELFAEMDFRRVATAVCGAGQDRIFVINELPVLAKNKHIETINDIPMQAVREMFGDVSADEAFKLVCLSELKMIYGQAKSDTKSPATRWRDFYDRLSFFEAERKYTGSKVAMLAPDQTRRKQEIIPQFGLSDLYVSHPSTWGGPLVPILTAAVVKTRLALH